MKPHPRIRKTVKWGGAVVTVLLVVVWIGSLWWQVSLDCGHGVDVGIAGGRLALAFDQEQWPSYPGKLALHRRPQQMRKMGWGPEHRVDIVLTATQLGIRGEHYAVPIWMLASGGLLGTVCMIRFDSLARRRARIGLCPKYRYDRAGLAADAVCPECGASAADPVL